MLETLLTNLILNLSRRLDHRERGDDRAVAGADAKPVRRRLLRRTRRSGGWRRRYVPDFLVRLVGGTTLALEIKGTDSPQNKAK